MDLDWQFGLFPDHSGLLAWPLRSHSPVRSNLPVQRDVLHIPTASDSRFTAVRAMGLEIWTVTGPSQKWFWTKNFQHLNLQQPCSQRHTSSTLTSFSPAPLGTLSSGEHPVQAVDVEYAHGIPGRLVQPAANLGKIKAGCYLAICFAITPPVAL